MIQVIVVLHLMVAAGLIGLILLQKSEGNASGAGFSGSASVESMMRPRARPNPLSRATAIFGVCFFVTSIALALLAKPQHAVQRSIILDAPSQSGGPSSPTVPTVDETPAAPAAGTAAPAPTPVPETTPSGGPAVPNK